MTTSKEAAREALDALYEKYYDEKPEAVYNRLIHVLHEHGIHKLECTYSGGHDEGGVEELQAWDKDGKEIEVERGWDQPVELAANQALSTRFFSWALGCSVYGTFHVDVGEKRMWSDGQIEQYVPDEENAIDWRW